MWRKFLTALPLDQLTFVIIGFVTDGVPTFVAIKINIASLFHALPDRLACAMVLGLDRANEAIETDIKSIIHLTEIA